MTETVREPRATRPRPPSARRRRRPERRPALRLRRVDGLDGLRVLGALAVVVYHVLGAVLEANPRVGVIMPPAAFTFFIISGFVIYRPFAASHVAGNPPTDLRRYAVGRAIRVLPLWWTALVVYLLVFGTGRLDSPLEWGATLTLTHYAVPGARFAVIGPAWALSVEWIFYLVVPIVAAGIAGAHRALAPRAEAASFQLAGLAAIGAVTAAVADLRPFVAIVVGMALAVVSIRQQQTRRTPAWLVVLRSPSTALAATVVAWLLLLDYPYREGLSVQWVQQDALIVAIWVAVALAWFTPVAFGSGTGLITRRLAAPAMVRLSFLTYGIYLWHDLVLRQVTEHLGTDVHLLAAMYLTLLGSVVLAATTFVLLERPLLGARERLRTRRAAPSRPPSARPSGPLAPVGPALDPTPERTPAVAPAAATPARTAAAPRERTAPARRGGSSGGAPGQGWIASIDGLRVLAAVCVITFHVGAEEEIPAAWSQALAAICIPIFATFFVVSGFVLYRPWTMAQARLAYGDGRPPTRAPDGGAVAFWFRRAVRVYPVYWVVQGTALAISGTGDLRTVTDWLQVITLFPLPNLDVIINHGLGVIVWTMIVELAYYLVLPFLARAVTGAIRGGQGFVAANGAVLGALFATFAWFGSTSTRLLGVAACIVIGMAIAALDAWQRANRRWAPGVRGLARQPARSLPVVAVAWGVGALAARGDDPNLLFRTHLGIHLAAMVAVSIVLFVPAVLGPTDGRYRRTLGSRPMRLLGPLTYGIYLWHYPVIRQTVERVDLPLPALQAWVLVVAPLMALLTYRAIEQPLDRLRHRRFGRTTPLAPADREATAR